MALGCSITSLGLSIAMLLMQSGMPVLIRISRAGSNRGRSYEPAVLTLLAEGFKLLLCVIMIHASAESAFACKLAALRTLNRFVFVARKQWQVTPRVRTVVNLDSQRHYASQNSCHI
jgi:hypothetical protein